MPNRARRGKENIFENSRGLTLPSIEQKDVSTELLNKIKADSRAVVSGNIKKPLTGRFVLKPAIVFSAAALILLSIFLLRPAREETNATFLNDAEYRMLDAKMISAENSLQALNMELFAELNDF
jgi:hypothetical protein